MAPGLLSDAMAIQHPKNIERKIMPMQSNLSGQIISKAKSLGANLAGIADMAILKRSPSHLIYPKMEQNLSVGASEFAEGNRFGEIAWPSNGKSVIVIAIEHNKDALHLDWWDGRNGTPGNRVLIQIGNTLSAWVEAKLNIKTHKLPYYVEKGGIFLKDAAVMAGLGCIGRNNLLVTPKFGPRIRLRAMILEKSLHPTGPVPFDPCEDCTKPCLRACPQDAFREMVCSPADMGMETLPGRNGHYSRKACMIQMEKDIYRAENRRTDNKAKGNTPVKYCRRCEFACILGRHGKKPQSDVKPPVLTT